MRENRLSGSMSGTSNGGMDELVRHRSDESAGKQIGSILNHHTTFRLYRAVRCLVDGSVEPFEGSVEMKTSPAATG